MKPTRRGRPWPWPMAVLRAVVWNPLMSAGLLPGTQRRAFDNHPVITRSLPNHIEYCSVRVRVTYGSRGVVEGRVWVKQLDWSLLTLYCPPQHVAARNRRNYEATVNHLLAGGHEQRGPPGLHRRAVRVLPPPAATPREDRRTTPRGPGFIKTLSELAPAGNAKATLKPYLDRNFSEHPRESLAADVVYFRRRKARPPPPNRKKGSTDQPEAPETRTLHYRVRRASGTTWSWARRRARRSSGRRRIR